MSNLSYVMTLSGPRRKPPALMGVFDPVKAHPWIAILGVLGGAYLAARKRRS